MKTLTERVFSKVANLGGVGCWPWVGSLDNYGYGLHQDRRRRLAAHRTVYVWLVGPIPYGLTVDHRCRNRVCVRPSHLEAVTNRENVLRGVGLSAQNARKTHCSRGHELKGENLYLRSNGKRTCRLCQQICERDRYARTREAR